MKKKIIKFLNLFYTVKLAGNSSKLTTKKGKFKEKSQKNKIKYVCKSHKLSLYNTLGKVSTTKIFFT